MLKPYGRGDGVGPLTENNSRDSSNFSASYAASAEAQTSSSALRDILSAPFVPALSNLGGLSVRERVAGQRRSVGALVDSGEKVRG